MVGFAWGGSFRSTYEGMQVGKQKVITIKLKGLGKSTINHWTIWLGWEIAMLID